MPDDNSRTYPEEVAQLLSEHLIRSPEDLTPGGFVLKEVKHPFKSGELLFYLSEYDGIYVFSKARSTSGRAYLYCFLCPRSRSCSHITMVGTLSPSFYSSYDSVDLDFDNPNSRLREEQVTELEDTLLSKARYPFDLDTDEDLRKVIRERTFTPIMEWFEANVPGGTLVAEPRKCCGADCEMVPTSNYLCELFSLHGYATLKPIQARICRICHARYDFDGRSLGILNYANKYLFTVELILDLLEFKSLSGTPTYSYWQAKCNTMLKSWTKESTLAFKKKWMSMAGRVNGIMTAFLTLVDYPSSHFQCCKDPEVVCIDGIVLSVESRRINTKSPWIDPVGLRGRFSKKEDRQIVTLTSQQKELLKNFIRTGVFLEDFQPLCEDLEDPIGQFLYKNLSSPPSPNHLIQCPSLLKRFYQCLYKWIAPASSIAPSTTWEILEQIISTRHVPFEHFPLLTDQAPIIADLCTYITTLSSYPDRYDLGIRLLQHILQKSKGCYSSPKPQYQNPLHPVGEEERVSYPSVMQEALETGAYFPGRNYHSVIKDIHLSNETAVCNKLYKKKGRLGAGTLLFWCGVHRKCLGFYIMQSAESCKTVFQILATRFTKQPRVIIYDNGCNLSEYILNRAPGPFKDTYILSDGFHWKNHTNCCVAYNSKLYPPLNSILV